MRNTSRLIRIKVAWLQALMGVWILPFCVSAIIVERNIPNGFHTVAFQQQVPVKILYAIALNESKVKTNHGRIIPWQYSLNFNGKATYYRSASALKQRIEELLYQGETLFDVGIAQVNYHWHQRKKQNFASLDAMINPYVNLTYAAQYLRHHYRREKDWWVAVGKYHAPHNTKNAQRYRESVRKIHQTL